MSSLTVEQVDTAALIVFWTPGQNASIGDPAYTRPSFLLKRHCF